MKKVFLAVTCFCFMSALCFGVTITHNTLRGGPTYNTLPFESNWSDTTKISSVDNWSAVAGIIGFRGTLLTDTVSQSTPVLGIDPQTIVKTTQAYPDVTPNLTNLEDGSSGVGEFELSDPVVALRSDSNHDAPYLVFYLNTSGASWVKLSYTLRDIDDSGRDTIQPIAVQYRTSTTSDFINIPAGYIADITTGPYLTQDYNTSFVLPATCANQPNLEIRFITAYTTESDDEWVGIDNFKIETVLTPVELSDFSTL